MQMDFATLTEGEYARALEAIEGVIDERLGDIRDPRFNRPR